MSVGIIEGWIDGYERELPAAVMYCNTTDWAFGPVFKDSKEAQAFLDWVHENHEDPRRYSDKELGDLVCNFRNRAGEDQKGRLVDVTVGEPTPVRKLTFEEHLTIERGNHDTEN